MDVKIKDRKENIEYLRMALNMAEVGVRYIDADLIIRISERLKKLNGKFSIKDGADVHHKWKEDWEGYFEAQEAKRLSAKAVPETE